jgi:hypothetical protein
MIINVWSTPRTGSNLFAYNLQRSLPGSFIVSEMFNVYGMTAYYTRAPVTGSPTDCPAFVPGAFYVDYYEESGAILHRREYSLRHRTVPQEIQHRMLLLERVADTHRVLIFRNHVAPLPDGVYNQLTSIAHQSYYTYRRDKRAQLGSFVIANSTNKFIAFAASDLTTGIVNDIPTAYLDSLMRQVTCWDSLAKPSAVAYEDMVYDQVSGLPIKQNIDYRIRLSDNMLNIIDELVIKYEQEKNMPL